MITWEEANALIGNGFQKRYGRWPTAVETYGLAALSSVMSNFGYHFADSPNKTDHNWSGMNVEALLGIKGWLDAKGCAAKGGSIGEGYYKGRQVCYVAQDSDAAGIDDLLFQLENNPAVYPALAEGDVRNLAGVLGGVGGQTLPEWDRYQKAIQDMFGSQYPAGKLGDALIAHLQDFESKTGQTSGWVVDWQGQPVGQYTGPGDSKSGGGATDQSDGGSGLVKWLLGGAAVAAVAGLAFYATKAR